MHHSPQRHDDCTDTAPLPNRRLESAFSLVEVTLAIGIIAFAFVALFGLLPTGMQTFRASVDATNDITMMQDMNAMVQVTAWKKIPDLKGDEFYFDEEGRRTDTKSNKSTDPAVKARRLYQVKLLIEDFNQPGGKEKLADAKRIVVVIADMVRPQSVSDFDSVNTSQDLKGRSGGKPLDVRSRTFIVTRMESENDI